MSTNYYIKKHFQMKLLLKMTKKMNNNFSPFQCVIKVHLKVGVREKYKLSVHGFQAKIWKLNWEYSLTRYLKHVLHSYNVCGSIRKRYSQ